jgi:hypothetical protein
MESNVYTVFTRTRHWNLSWVRRIQFISSHPVSMIHFTIIPPSTPKFPGVVSSLQVFRPIFCVFRVVYRIHLPSHSPWLDHSNNLWWKHKLWNSSLYNVLQPTAIMSLLDPNILLSTLFSDTLDLCFLRSWQTFTAIQKKKQIKLCCSFVYFNPYVFR